MEQQTQTKNTNKIKGFLSVFINILLVLFIIFLVFNFIFTRIYTRVYVVGSSMSSTLTGATNEKSVGGDYVLISNSTPTYGDIVVVSRGEKSLIKRAIAFEGDTLYLDCGKLYLKKSGESEFKIIDESYIDAERNSNSELNTFPKKHGALDTEGHTVGVGCVFVLGDNRDNSSDSRGEYGDFKMSEVQGTVTKWSIDNKSVITGWYTFWDFTIGGIFS